MYVKILRHLFLPLLCAIPFVSFAQNIVIKGRVTDSKTREPLPGVTVEAKSSRKGTFSDGRGTFSLSISPGDSLQFSLVGYFPTKMVASGELNVTMERDVKGLNEVVVLGYGQQNRATVTASVATVKGAEIEHIPASNLSNLLAGRMAGVFVTQTTGVPGQAAAVRVRSAASWNTTANANDALYVIDGVVRNKGAFDALDPNEVDEVTVLKDAASAAMYGARSSNGVILVTTKRGKSGKAQITYSGTYTIDQPIHEPKMMDAYQTALNMNMLSPDPTDGNHWGDDELAWLKQHGAYDWYGMIKKSPVTNRHALSVSGGNEDIRYYLGGSYYDESGFLPNLKFQRYNIRGNMEAKITKNLTATLQLSNEYGERKQFIWEYDDPNAVNMWDELQRHNWYTPPYIDGKLVHLSSVNIFGQTQDAGYQKNSTQRTDALMALKYNIAAIPGLSAKVSFSKNITAGYTKQFQKKFTDYNFKRTGSTGKLYSDTLIDAVQSAFPSREYLANTWTKDNEYQFNTQLSYTHDFGKHHVDAVAVYEQYEENYNDFNGTRYDFPLIVTDQFYATSDESKNFSLNGDESQAGRLSYIGRVNYDYAGKYLFSASLRRDGSTKFAPDKRWGSFPAVSAGWVMSDESFFKVKAVDRLKIRASYGLTGNDAVGGWQWMEKYNSAAGFYFGNQSEKGIQYGGTPNPNLTWEKSGSLDVGVDATLFTNFDVKVDYWTKHTYDILGPRILSLPSSFGGGQPDENYGKVNSWGYELEVGYHNTIAGSFNYFIKGNFSFATNKVIQKDVAENAQDVDNPNGKTLDYVAGYRETGMIRTQADLDKLPAGYTIFGKTPILGILNYADLSGAEGKPDGKIDNYDRTVLANHSNAPYSMGLTLGGEYKGFSLQVFLQGVTGASVWYNDSYNRHYTSGDNRPYAFWNDHWSPENVNAKYPRLAYWDATPDDAASTFWLNNGSYVRVKDISLGYSLPQHLVNRAHMQNIRLSVSCTNLLTFTQFKYYDPELPKSNAYPINRTFTFGLNVAF